LRVLLCHRDCHRAAKYQAKLDGIESGERALKSQLKWALWDGPVLGGIPKVELQNRVHQFNSGRGLHQYNQCLAMIICEARRRR
jgi:hypothetical protein